MKIIILLLISILFFNIAFCDELRIPYSCFPKALQAKFSEHNLKLDLDGNDRTQGSWGFLKNEGAKYTIYTYRSVTTDELNLVMKIAGEVGRGENEIKN